MENLNFYIKNGYTCNPVSTFSEKPTEYWNEERINKSTEFQYHVYQHAAKLFMENGYNKVLDIGAGPGTKLKHFFNTEAIDLCLIDQPGMEDIVRSTLPNARFIGYNLETPFQRSETFDMIICADVIEHLQNPNALLTSLHNLMSENSLAIISTPDRDLRRGKSNKQSPNKAHVREWNKGEFRKYLESNGFHICAHRNLPLKRLPTSIFKLSQIPPFYGNIRKSTWFACQMIVINK